MKKTLRRLLIVMTAALLGVSFTSPAAGEPDTEALRLTSWSVDAGPYRLGDEITFRFTVNQPEQLLRMQIVYREDTTHQAHAFGGHWSVQASDEIGLITFADGVGTFTYTVPSTPQEGPNSVAYQVEQITIQDRDGNFSWYGGDGSFSSDTLPWGSHDVDLTGDVTFVDTGRDYTPPVLNSVSISAFDVGVKEQLTVTYSASDPNLSRVYVIGTDQHKLGVGLASDVDNHNPIPGTASHQWSFDRPLRVALQQVVLVDLFNNQARYYPDGRVELGVGGSPPRGQSTHQIPMPTTPIMVRPQPASSLAAQAGTGSVRLTWSQQPGSAHSVVVSPGGRVVTGQAEIAARDITISGLASGVPHTFSVTTKVDGVESHPVTTTATPRMAAARVFGTGDRNRDGRADLWAAPSVTNPSSNTTWRVYHGAGGGTLGRAATTSIPATRAPIPGSATGRGPGASMGALYLSGSDLVEPTATGSRVIGKGFNIFRTIDAASDFTSDGVADLIGITPAGDLYLYTSTPTGGIGRGVRLGSGWSTFNTVFSPGDFNGDSRADLVAVDGVGKLWLYPGNGRGGFTTRVLIGSGWATFGAVLPMRDLSGDGKADLGAITTDGRLIMYPGNGRSSFLAKKLIGSGWGAFL